MKILAVCAVAIGLFVPGARADDGGIVAGTTTTISALAAATDYYTFEPKDDVTAPELAKAIVAIMPALTPSCANGWQHGCDVKDAIKALPPAAARHFVHHEH